MVGSEPPPGAGSVMAKDERTLPSTIGFSHFSFCAGVPSFFSTFMLPSSGAMQLKASGPNSERAASSYITAQATIGRSMPPYSFGDCGAHRPAFLRLLAHRLEPLVRDVLVLGEILRVAFERQHVLLDEGARRSLRSAVQRPRSSSGGTSAVKSHVSTGSFATLSIGREEVSPRHHLAAVAHDGRAGDVSAGVGREQQQRAVEIAVLAEAADRNVARERLALPRSTDNRG